MTWYVLLIGVIAVERLAELLVSNRHREWSRGQGGTEFGAGHYPTMVVLRMTRRYRVLTAALIRASAYGPARSNIVPAAEALPRVFGRLVNLLAQ